MPLGTANETSMNELNSKKGNKDARLKLVFFGVADLRVGRGIERTIMNYAKWFPKDIWNITVVDTSYLPEERFSLDFVRSFLEGVKLVKHSYEPRLFNRLKAARSIVGRVYTAFSFMLIDYYYKFVKERAFWKTLAGADVVYLARNQDSMYWGHSRRRLIVGTNHLSFSALIDEHLDPLRSLEFKLIKAGLLLRNIDAFHFTTSRGRIDSVIGKRMFAAIPSGVDAKRFYPSEQKATDKPADFLYLASLEYTKGVGILLDAWKTAGVTDGSRLHIVGDGPLRELVLQTAKEAGNIVYHGVVDDEELAKLYRDCDVFIYPSVSDNFGLVVIEALASGCYVLCSAKHRGIFDEFDQQKSLEYVEPFPEQFAAGVHKAIENIDKIRSPSRKKKAHDLVVETFDWESIGKRLSDQLLEWLKQKRTGKMPEP